METTFARSKDASPCLFSARVGGFTVLAVTVASVEAVLRVLGPSSDDAKRMVSGSIQRIVSRGQGGILA